MKNYQMTEAEIKRAMALLDKEDVDAVDQIRLGLWVIANENGVMGIYKTKAEGIEDALSLHNQAKEKCRVRRHRAGVYDLRILDIDEDPAERFFHEYSLERVTASNILRYREMVLSNCLPEWYFNPYSEEYKEYFGREV